ncbi:MAG TPA: DegV family protein [Anaerolineae bacterium]|nr:DegV family protein [Anaerolineae bacterium]
MLKIISDTTTGLTKGVAAQHGVDLVPQIVMFGSETLRDGVDITNDVFLQRLKASKAFPTTSQPSVGDFLRIFKPLLDAGHEILCITVSSYLSGTYNSAETAKKELGSDRITLVDSKTVAAAEALLVLEAAHMTRDGKSAPEIASRLDALIPSTTLDFVLDTVEYLVKGGRATRIQGIIGTMLQLKPVFSIRNGTGHIEVLERIRTRNKALARLRGIVDEALHGKSKFQLAVTHTGLHGEAEALAHEFRGKYGLGECMVIEMPPAVAAHAGPGALGAAYVVED